MAKYSRHIIDFNIAGMRYWDGALVLESLKPGMTLDLNPEFDNEYDHNAVEISFEGTRLGFVPRDINPLLAQAIRFGHGDIVECRILKVDPQAETWEQVRVGLYFTDNTAE